MFKEDDATVEDVAKFLQKFLQIVRITSDEQYRLDVELKLKREMPAGWTFQNGSVYARLEEADIKWTPYEK
jgi:hypothetical protein